MLALLLLVAEGVLLRSHSQVRTGKSIDAVIDVLGKMLKDFSDMASEDKENWEKYSKWSADEDPLEAFLPKHISLLRSNISKIAYVNGAYGTTQESCFENSTGARQLRDHTKVYSTTVCQGKRPERGDFTSPAWINDSWWPGGVSARLTALAQKCPTSVRFVGEPTTWRIGIA